MVNKNPHCLVNRRAILSLAGEGNFLFSQHQARENRRGTVADFAPVSGSETNTFERPSQTVQIKVCGSQCFWLGVWPSKASLCSICNNSLSPYNCLKWMRSVTCHADEKTAQGPLCPGSCWAVGLLKGGNQTDVLFGNALQPAVNQERGLTSGRMKSRTCSSILQRHLHQHCHCMSEIQTDSVSCTFICDIWQPCQAPPLISLAT